MRTLCEKCIFADYSDSEQPCKMNIISEISEHHQLEVSENNFNVIPNYICKYGFSLEVYDKNKEQIGSIDNLQKIVANKARIMYYLIVEITDSNNIVDICSSINSLEIKPVYCSFLLNQQNNTQEIIGQLKEHMKESVEWKIHNFLEDTDINHMLSIVTDTNAKNNDSVYFWLDKDTNHHLWGKDIQNINSIIYIQQPSCYAMFRSEKKDGLLLSFDLYKTIKKELGYDIFKALNSLPNPQFAYYA